MSNGRLYGIFQLRPLGNHVRTLSLRRFGAWLNVPMFTELTQNSQLHRGVIGLHVAIDRLAHASPDRVTSLLSPSIVRAPRLHDQARARSNSTNSSLNSSAPDMASINPLRRRPNSADLDGCVRRARVLASAPGRMPHPSTKENECWKSAGSRSYTAQFHTPEQFTRKTPE